METLRIEKICSFIHPDESELGELQSEVFGYVDEFVLKHFDEDFCEVLFCALPEKIDLRKIGRLLDILIWSTPDNGTKLHELTKDWIRSDNPLKIEIQLSRMEWLPDSNDWYVQSSKIKAYFPKLQSLCAFYDEELIRWTTNGSRQILQLKQELAKLHVRE